MVIDGYMVRLHGSPHGSRFAKERNKEAQRAAYERILEQLARNLQL